jgi:hypothetical protein
MAACANPLAVFTRSLISLSLSRPPPLSLSRARAFGTGSRSSYPHLDNRRKIKNEFKARKYPRKGGYLKDSQLLCAEENKKHPSPSRAKKNSCSLFCPVFKIEGFSSRFPAELFFFFFQRKKEGSFPGAATLWPRRRQPRRSRHLPRLPLSFLPGELPCRGQLPELHLAVGRRRHGEARVRESADPRKRTVSSSSEIAAFEAVRRAPAEQRRAHPRRQPRRRREHALDAGASEPGNFGVQGRLEGVELRRRSRPRLRLSCRGRTAGCC